MAARDVSDEFYYIITKFNWMVPIGDKNRENVSIHFPLACISGNVSDSYVNTKNMFPKGYSDLWSEYVDYKMTELLFGMTPKSINTLPYVAQTTDVCNIELPKLYSSCKKITYHDVDVAFRDLFRVDSWSAIHFILQVCDAYKIKDATFGIIKSTKCYNTLSDNMEPLKWYIKQIMLFDWYREFLVAKYPQELPFYDYNTIVYAANCNFDWIEATIDDLLEWQVERNKSLTQQ